MRLATCIRQLFFFLLDLVPACRFSFFLRIGIWHPIRPRPTKSKRDFKMEPSKEHRSTIAVLGVDGSTKYMPGLPRGGGETMESANETPADLSQKYMSRGITLPISEGITE